MKIKATIIAHSKSAINDKEIITWELEYPRFIHAEFLTHRMFSRNAASSRAIPVSKVIEMVRKTPAMPVRFGANQAGMQDKGVDHDAMISGWDGDGLGGKIGEFIPNCFTPEFAWRVAANTASMWSEVFAAAGYHKQIANRLTEPFQWMKTVMTTTEDANWFYLRDHPDADPTIAELAHCMAEVKKNSTPVILKQGDWHTPYYECGYWSKDHLDTVGWYDKNGVGLEDALVISSSCCAQVSYRLLDESIEKARTIYNRLVESKPVHASPFEHQATPMEFPNWRIDEHPWEDGVTHMDRAGNLWSGNHKGWIQHRQLIPNNVYQGEAQ